MTGVTDAKGKAGGKKVSLRTLLRAGAVLLAAGGGIFAVWYVIFFRDSRPLAWRVPAEADVFVSVPSPAEFLRLLPRYLPVERIEGYPADTAGKLGLFLGDEAVFFREGKSWGVGAKLSVPGACLAGAAGFLPGVRKEVKTLGANRVDVLRAGGGTWYLCRGRNTAFVTPSPGTAAKVGELLNMHPIRLPLAASREFRRMFVGGRKNCPVYVRFPTLLPPWVRIAGLSGVSGAGGSISFGPAAVRLRLDLAGTVDLPPPGRPRECPGAFLTASLAVHVKDAWEYAARAVRKKPGAYSSFTVALFSGSFDPVVSMLDGSVSVYGFAPRDPAGMPSFLLILPLRGQLGAGDLRRAVGAFVEKARGINDMRVKKYGRRRITYTLVREAIDGGEVLRVRVTPSLVPGFAPGVCLAGRRLFVAADYRDIGRLLSPAGGPPSGSRGYVLVLRHPGFGILTGFLKKLFSDPLSRTRLGEARTYRLMEYLDRVGTWTARLGGIRIEEVGRRNGRIAFRVEIFPR